MKKLSFLALCVLAAGLCHSQESLPTDYLSKEFHTGRREALRKLLPDHSVAVVFAFPSRTFSNDVTYPYHPNPDLYYLSGYKEPNAVLLIFKEPQTVSGQTFNELFFIQKRDPQAEQWTGRRMGVEKVKAELGFTQVFNGSDFKNYPINLSSFSQILFAGIPDDVHNDAADSADLYDLLEAFKQKANLPASFSAEASELIGFLSERATGANLTRIKTYVERTKAGNEKIAHNELVIAFLNCKDSADLVAFRQKAAGQKWNTTLYVNDLGSLREIKTSEEMSLMRKTVSISAIAHAETMRAVQPGMSESELQGIQEYVHKKLGAEYVGYPSIVGAGANGCILHYEENTKTHISKELVLMDVGAEYHGYSADVTRTFPSTGKFTPDQKAIYDLVYDAQEEVFKLCHEGVPFERLNQKAAEVLANGLLKLGVLKDKKDIGLYYPHGCSHFLGLDVHDAGNYNQTLKENMVITVEPGIYIPAGSPCDKKWWDIGVRIEDDVRIGKDKVELLSWQAPRKSEDVEKKAAEKSALNDLALPKPL